MSKENAKRFQKIMLLQGVATPYQKSAKDIN